jgi:hypothetical protein
LTPLRLHLCLGCLSCAVVTFRTQLLWLGAAAGVLGAFTMLATLAAHGDELSAPLYAALCLAENCIGPASCKLKLHQAARRGIRSRGTYPERGCVLQTARMTY